MIGRWEPVALRIAVVLAAIVPLAAGGAGMVQGAAFLKLHTAAGPLVDASSHIRYLSGLLFGIGIAFLVLVPRIERHRLAFGLLSGIVAVGGLARLASLGLEGPPSAGHLFGLFMELGVVPSLALWQRRVSRRAA